jgi:hypothetical protein
MFIACYGNYKNIRYGLPLIGIVNLLLGEVSPGARKKQNSKRKQIANQNYSFFFHQIPPIIKAVDAIKILIRCDDFIVLSISPPFLFAVPAKTIPL